MTQKEKFLSLVSQENSETIGKIQFRKENRKWLRESKRIAIKILVSLKEKKLSQKDLAKMLSVSPQQISKLVKGNENLTLDTMTKLETVLGITIFESSRIDSNYIVNAISYTKEYNKEELYSFDSQNVVNY